MIGSRDRQNLYQSRLMEQRGGGEGSVLFVVWMSFFTPSFVVGFFFSWTATHLPREDDVLAISVTDEVQTSHDFGNSIAVLH